MLKHPNDRNLPALFMMEDGEIIPRKYQVEEGVHKPPIDYLNQILLGTYRINIKTKHVRSQKSEETLKQAQLKESKNQKSECLLKQTLLDGSNLNQSFKQSRNQHSSKAGKRLLKQKQLMQNNLERTLMPWLKNQKKTEKKLRDNSLSFSFKCTRQS